MNLFGLQMSHLVCAGNGGTNILVRRRPAVRSGKRLRYQWRRLRGDRERGRAGGHANCKFQKVASLHDFRLLFRGERRKRV
jgi:hypothetical protein